MLQVLGSVEFGGYVSLIKLLVVLLAFFGWLPLVNWVYEDTQSVRTNKNLWTIIIGLIGSLSLIFWLLIPAFIIGLLIFVAAVGGAMMAYIIHRNSLVADFEKVLTAEHFRNLFVNAEKNLEKASRGMQFITANGNDVPLPEPKSKEAMGFTVTCEIVDDAIWRRASQVLFSPGKDDYAVVYMIDGVPEKQPPRTKEEMEHFVSYIKELAALEAEEKRKPQQGRFSVVMKEDPRNRIIWELNTAGSTAGEQVKMVHIEEAGLKKVADLGFNENQLEAIESLRKETGGLVLISGPKLSGRTMTMYALLRNHDPFLYNINTLEKKTSAELQNITQNVYTLSDTGTTTYSRKLQTILRRGPDIIGIDECDDPQCAKLAVTAAADGKTVYAVIEAQSVGQALEKWFEMVGDKAQVVKTLLVVINQRLVRVLCEDCRVAYKPNPSLFKKFNIPANDVDMFYRPGEVEYDKHGKPIICEKCQGTGYRGRTGLYETIRMTAELKEAIQKAGSPQEIVSALRKAGMLYMQEQSIKKVALGTTSINEVIRNFSAKNV